MDWLRDFQQSFREPVYGFLGTFWPVLAVIVLIGLGWLFGSMVQRARSTGSSDSGGGLTILGDSDGDGGDGGGGGD
jgi:uncharacterized membrane protein